MAKEKEIKAEVKAEVVEVKPAVEVEVEAPKKSSKAEELKTIYAAYKKQSPEKYERKGKEAELIAKLAKL
jgi:hypothetical protein